MHLWIATIGSSDIQLISDKANQAKGRTEKQRSDKVWSYWYTDELQEEFYDISKEFAPKPLFQGQSYRIFPRVLGKIYQASSETIRAEIWDYLTFPLLDNFVRMLVDHPAPEAIVVLLTDQSTIFESDRQRKPNSPYWQDTCELQPILHKYFAEKFPDTRCKFTPLIPNSEAESLENWNAVLGLVRGKFRNLEIAEQPIQVNPQENVYVSHQAGTPAISSAVQFCSLAKFSDRVKFLVSNEQDTNLTDVVESSTYLRGIEIQQAKKLLARYDYSGTKEVLQRQIDEVHQLENEPKPEDEQLKYLAYLLDVAIQWNFAKFEDFAKGLLIFPDKSVSDQAQAYLNDPDHYWWTAYEAAHLAVVRLKQGNTVEALFHSFRSVEGLISEWARWKYPNHVKYEQDNYGKWAWFVHQTIQQDLPNYRVGKFPRDGRIKLFSQSLYDLLQEGIPEARTDLDMTVFLNDARDQRNELFHQLMGLTKLKVYEAWSIPFVEEPKTAEEWNKLNQDWQTRLLSCLKCVCDQDFELLDRECPDGDFASLMVKVHQELERAIANL